MRKRKMAAWTMVAVIAGGLLAGCGEETVQENTGKEKTEVTFFHYLEQYQSQFDKMVELYAEANPDVELKVECIGSDYDKILQTRVAL